MTQPTLDPATEFYLALLDKEAHQFVGTMHPQYLADLYPIGDRTAQDYADLILSHVDGWLERNLQPGTGSGRYLNAETLNWLQAYLMEISFNLMVVINEDIQEIIQRALLSKYQVMAAHAGDLTRLFTTLMWLKLAIYGDDIGLKKIAFASRLWQETATHA